MNGIFREKMCKRILVIILAVGGVILLGLSVILTAADVSDMDIIGGTSITTVSFVFFRQHGGAYFIMALFGVISSISALIIGLLNNKKKHCNKK